MVKSMLNKLNLVAFGTDPFSAFLLRLVEQEVADQFFAAFGGEGFWVELDALDWVVFVAYAHDFEITALLDLSVIFEGGNR